MNVSSRLIAVSRSASASSALVPKHVRSANSPRPGSYSKIDPPSASESSTAWATIVVRTSSASRLELTAWLISPSARSSSTERASSAPRSWSSRKSWTFEIAIAPWAANVVTSSIVSSPNGSTSVRLSTTTPTTRPPMSIGTPSSVWKRPRSSAACHS